MKIAIVNDSRTGTTAAAARAMAKLLEDHGHRCSVERVDEADPASVASADLVCVGSWTQGLFLVLQHPTAASMAFIDRLGDLHGKRAVVFCTYKIATGKTLDEMARALERKGARVVGRFRFRGPKVGLEFARFAGELSNGAS